MIKVEQFSCRYERVKERIESFANKEGIELITCNILPAGYERCLDKYSFNEKCVYITIVYKET